MKTNVKVTELLVSYSNNNINPEQKISNSDDSYDIAMNLWNLNTIQIQEEVKVIFLNDALMVLGCYSLSKGGISSSIVDIRLILSVALKAIATGIILVHNHPTGNLKPSKADLDITKKLKSACDVMGINLLDHLIISKESYFSFSDEGLL
ncbi:MULTISPECIES: RadC family protein [unclassified Chryseobacterium]|uniref:JAB domain-containing protein n=1 Tax=unclassified Chryseobacterium TaxID=2593645 RepID=UPI00100B3E06|nr:MULTISPECIES: JAB domain-containing protein [unclassified Chryseobacterium]RXM50008.1 DNA repair protein [Chryseobacterium sp. CH25]RXM62926.1 DNA repair protein [Chryseobacterium sp. CH1]